MRPTAKYLVLFLAGFVMLPAAILFHEVRHYAAAACLGYHPRIHFHYISWPRGEQMSRTQSAITDAAGPLGDAVLAGAGLLWLYWLRRHRREVAPTLADWLATLLAVQAGRWLRGFSLFFPFIPQLSDERGFSRALGMPPWLLPLLLGFLCLMPLGAMVRLHPPGARLFPFTCLSVGAVGGGLVWMHLLGPRLLP